MYKKLNIWTLSWGEWLLFTYMYSYCSLLYVSSLQHVHDGDYIGQAIKYLQTFCTIYLEVYLPLYTTRQKLISFQGSLPVCLQVTHDDNNLLVGAKDIKIKVVVVASLVLLFIPFTQSQ